MKRIVFLLVVSLFAFPATDSFAKTKPTKAKTKAQRLVDKQLDRITAGSTDVNDASDASGGAIVGNSSTASIKNTGNVELDGGAQQDARALNLVNAAESGVANGVNVWDGRLDGQTAETELNVDQHNTLIQTKGRSANLPEYVRSEANVDKAEARTWNNGGESLSFESHELIDFHSDISTRSVTSTSEVGSSPTFSAGGIEVNLGGGARGFAGSGDLDIHIDGGGANVTFTADLAGILKGTVDIGVDLPNIDVDFSGTMCVVIGGFCKANGSLNDSDSVISDFQERFESSSSSSFFESGTSELALSLRSPVSLYDAEAEYIVVDESALEVTTDYSVLIGGTTQQNARALNLVNAAGSLVANAVNVSRTPTVGPVLNLNQSNVIIQRQ